MRRLMVAICLALAGGSGAGLAVHPALAASLCVGTGPGCYSTIQAALNAAHNGDVIQIGPGTFAGGITIDVNVTIVGAGAGSTIIKGGGNGPVMRIGVYLASSEPNVSISGVTITGGTNTSDSVPGSDAGGGITVEPSASGTAGTITISDSAITGNSVSAPTTFSCGLGCTGSFSAGGGIVNYGTMTLTNTIVSNNTVSNNSPAPNINVTIGGGIGNAFGAALTVHHSTITANTVTIGPTDSPGFFLAGGGIDSGGTISIDDSTLSSNRVIGMSTNPNADSLGIGGGIHVDSTATIQRSQISGNSVTMSGPAQNMGAGAGGIDDDGSLTLSTSIVSNNHTRLNYTASTPPENAGADAGGMEVDGSVSIANTTFDGNSASAIVPIASVPGPAGGAGGALFLASPNPVSITNSTFIRNSARNAVPSGNVGVAGGAIFSFSSVTMTNDVIDGNTASATTGSGEAGVGGGGIVNGGSLTLSHSTVTRNNGIATGDGGLDQGGGIWNGDLGNGPPQLTLSYSTIMHNTLTATRGVTVQGGGLYTTAAVTEANSVIAQNSPDQCFGC